VFKLPGLCIGKRAQSKTTARSGRYVKAVRVGENERHYDVAVDATLRAVMMRQGGAAAVDGFTIGPQDLRKKDFNRPGTTLIVLVVDGSDSMGQGTFVRMKAAKGAALALLTKARLRRYRIGMVTFRGRSAQIVLPPTASLALARQKLNSLPTGGATPLAHGLMTAWRMIRTERLKNPAIQPLMVVLSDGEANVPYQSDGERVVDVMEELHRIAHRIGRDRIHSILIDTLPRWEAKHPMRDVAQSMDGAYHHVDRLGAATVVETIYGVVA
jgi:magnesium chelatase subunit D